MSYICPHCENHYVSNYNLKRHIEQKHECLSDEETDTSEISDETDSEKSTNEDSDQSSDEQNEDAESDSYTFDEVRAILRYVLQSKDT